MPGLMTVMVIFPADSKVAAEVVVSWNFVVLIIVFLLLVAKVLPFMPAEDAGVVRRFVVFVRVFLPFDLLRY